MSTIHDGFTEESAVYFDRYRHLAFVSISDSQRSASPALNYLRTVYHGIPVIDFAFSSVCETAEPYLAFLGRMSPEKAPDLAITAALKSGWRLKMAAKIASHELDYWKTSIEPLVDGDQIQYLGELGHDAKCELIGGAAAMLFPIQWNEPFGLVMVESLACGTPVVASRNGSVPEIIQHGRTGFIVNSINEMVNAIARIHEISREDCRVDAETRFSDSRMAQDYLEVYERLIGSDSLSNAPMMKLEAAD